jgi:flotillin
MDKVVLWGGANGSESGVSSFVKDLAGTVPPVLQMLRDIGGVRVNDRIVSLDSDDAAQVSAPVPAPIEVELADSGKKR